MFNSPVITTLVENFGFYGDEETAKFHFGLDFSNGSTGSDVFSVASGRVVFSVTFASQDAFKGYGYSVVIQHRDDAGNLIDRFSIYAHLQNPPLVSAGSSVVAGQHIGDVGATGGNYAPHLHFSVLGGLREAGMITDTTLLSSTTLLGNLETRYALQIGTFGADSGVPTYQPGSPPYYGNIINPGTIYGDLRGPSNDWILPIAGNDIVDGRTGIDTVEYQESIDRIWFYRVDATTTISIVTSATGATQGDILYNVERLSDNGRRNLIDLASADLQTLFVGSSSASTRYVVPSQEYRNVEVDGGGGQDTVVVWGVRSDWQVVDVAGPGYWLTSNSTPPTSGLRTASATSSVSGPYTIQITDVERVEFADGTFAVTSLVGGVSGRDLTVGAVGLSTSGASPGSDITVSFDVLNIGNQASGSTRGEIILSSSPDFSGSVRVLDTFNIGALDASGGLNSSRTYTETLTLPVDLGRTNYYVGVRVDTTNSITEVNEGNNLGISSALAVGGGLSGDPDLRVAVTSFPDGYMVLPGGAVTLSFTISADADGAVPYTYRVYYSADAALSADDVVLQEATTARGLGYFGVHYYDLNLSLPGSAGTGVGYFFVQADPNNVMVEQREDNNVRSRPILISPDSPDADDLPDLFAQRVHLRDADRSAPIATLFAGEQFNYAVDFGNYSPDDAIPEVRDPDLRPSFHNALIISEDAIFTLSDRVLDLSLFYSLAAGEYYTTSSSSTITLPSDLASGTYYIAVVADYFNTISEETESNNVSLIQQVEVVNNIPTSVSAVGDSLSLVNATSTNGSVLSNDVFQLFSTPIIDRVSGTASLLGTEITLSSGAVFQLNVDGAYSLKAEGVLASMSVGSQVTETISYRAVGVNGDASTAEIEITISRADPDTGGIGNDQVNGTQWNDLMRGREGHDSVSGFNGNDELYGDSGNDILLGGAGLDTLDGGAGNDYLYGGEGNDTLYGEAGDDAFFGEAGHDILVGGAGADYIDAGDGFDYADGGDTNDIFLMGAGNDTVLGQSGNDYADLGEGDDVAYGGTGEDILLGGLGNDVLVGEGGADYIDAGEGFDYADGGDANDIFLMGAGNDTALGQAGNDYFDMGEGDDTAFGGTGDDIFLGGAGNDVFEGGSGLDVALGGAGNDSYTVRASSGLLLVYDFAAGGAEDGLLFTADTGITSFAQAQTRLSFNASVYASVLTVDADTSVWLVGVTNAQLTAADFAFV